MSILIADSGSTKTDWVLIEKNEVVFQFQTMGFNPYFQNTEFIFEELKSTLLPALQNQLNSINQVFYYGTGCSTPEKVHVIKQALNLAFGDIFIDIDHDLLASARALCGKQKGIACILGTGSNSCLYDSEIITENVPSYGFLFGDHGSGAVIGKIFIQHYFDDKLPLFLKLAFEQAGYHRENILDNVYKKPMPNKYLASIVTFLVSYAKEEYIKNLIKKCFSDFFDHQVSKYSDAKSLTVNSVGSIGFYFKDLLNEVAHEKGYKLGKVIKSPIDGLITYHCEI